MDCEPMDTTDMPETFNNLSLTHLPIDKLYEVFSLQAWDLPEVLASFDALKEKLGVQKLIGLELYQQLKVALGGQNSKAWKARDVLNQLEKRANQKEYMHQTAAKGVRVVIIGAGPVGLRLAIDCILLGAEVVVVEKRSTFSRNNVLHLWPFTIEDLKQLGAKKFYGKFCAGAIDHISIRSLQCILLKICLMLGGKLFTEVEFEEILEPNEQIGWHAKFNPSDHPLNKFEFDVLVGAEGARKSRVPGFDRKELRGKLALAITANFKNYGTREEAAVDEISGVAFIFNQKFFKELKADTDIDLENIVYYRDDTHYFVMTAKKDSLLRKGVLREDYSDAVQLLDRSNIDQECLYDYATEAADWSTDLPRLDFALNHHNKPDVALFDFTSIHQAEYAARAINRNGKDLYLCLVGDALLEPFWPIGTGAARGFLSAMDTAWLIRGLGQGRRAVDLLCERECIFQRLPQTTPEKLQKNTKNYTIDPQTRYPNLHIRKLRPDTIKYLYDLDQDFPSPALRLGSVRVKRTAEAAIVGGADSSRKGGGVGSRTEDENKENLPEAKKVKEEVIGSPSRKPLLEKGHIHRAYYAQPEETLTLKDPKVLQDWLHEQVKGYGIEIKDLSSSWSNGLALCALIHRYHPELIPNFHELSPKNPVENNKLAFSVAAEHLGVTSLIKPTEMKKPDKLALFTYLSLFYELFLNQEPASLSEPEDMVFSETPPTTMTTTTTPAQDVRSPPEESIVASPTSSITGSGKSRKKSKSKSRKKSILSRRGTKSKLLATSPPSAERSWNTKSIVRRPSVTTPTSPTSKDLLPGSTPMKTTVNKPAGTPKTSRPPSTTSQFRVSQAVGDSSDYCYFCGKRVYLMERMSANDLFFHRSCFRCSHCNCQLKIGGYSLSKGVGGEKGKFFCSTHYRQLFLSNPEAINYSRADAPKREGSTSDLNQDQQTATPHRLNLKSSSSSSIPTPTSVHKDIIMEEVEPSSLSDDHDEVFEQQQKKEEEKKKRKESKKRGWFSWWRSEDSPEAESPKNDETTKVLGNSLQKSDDAHRVVGQEVSSAPPLKNGVAGGTQVSKSPFLNKKFQVETNRDVDPPVKLRAPVRSGIVARLSQGFEILEATARDSEIQLSAEGREKAKASLSRESSTTQLQPFENPLLTISEGSEGQESDVNQEGVVKASTTPPKKSPESIKRKDSSSKRKGSTKKDKDSNKKEEDSSKLSAPPTVPTEDKSKTLPPTPSPASQKRLSRTPAEWRGLSARRQPPEEVTHIPRSSYQTTGRVPKRANRGQRSVARPMMIGNYGNTDVAIQERRKRQQRLHEAQTIQREMSLLERQYEELEEVGRHIEQVLRDVEDTSQEDQFMKSWLNLVNERNGLVRKTAELSLKMKELELDDRQYEVDKELNEIQSICGKLSPEEEQRFEELCEAKIKIVEERHEIVMQLEEERIRELEEDETTGSMLDVRYGNGRQDSSDSDGSYDHVPDSDDVVFRERLPSASVAPEERVEAILNKKEKRRSRVVSWFFGQK